MKVFAIVNKVLIILGINEMKSHKYGRLISIVLRLTAILAQFSTILTSGWYFAIDALKFQQRTGSTMLVVGTIYTQITFDVVWSHCAALMSFMARVQHTAEQRTTFLLSLQISRYISPGSYVFQVKRYSVEIFTPKHENALKRLRSEPSSLYAMAVCRATWRRLSYSHISVIMCKISRPS